MSLSQALEEKSTGLLQGSEKWAQRNNRYLSLALYACVFGLYFMFTHEQIVSPLAYPSDLPTHIRLATALFAGHGSIAYPGLYVLWFLVSRVPGVSMAQAAMVVDPLLMVAVAVIMQYVLRRARFSTIEQILYTGTLIVAGPIYISGLVSDIYLGQITSSVYHNPTLLALKPFAFLSLLLYGVAFRRGGSAKWLALAALALALSAIMKPNFVLAFAPALVLLLLIKRCRFEQWWKTTLVVAPAVVVLAIQYVLTYKQPGDGSSVIFDFMTVWKLFSADPLASLVVSLAFPLCVLVFRWKRVLANDFLVLSWLTLGVAIVEFACFAEGGKRLGAGNFAWGMQAAIPLVFLFSAVELVRWLKDTARKRPDWRLQLTYIVLALHVVTGVFYIVQISSTGWYF